jgi:hypothetical protein
VGRAARFASAKKVTAAKRGKLVIHAKKASASEIRRALGIRASEVKIAARALQIATEALASRKKRKLGNAAHAD